MSAEVVVAGAGPAGLLLACELRLAGVATVVLERDAQRPGFCRGFNLNARALDLLARRGLAAGLVAEGWPVPHAAFSGVPVPLLLAGADTDHPYTLGIPQTRVEEVLEERARELGADLRRGHEVRAVAQGPDEVVVTVAAAAGGYELRAAYLVGCDGGRSTVRKRAGIAFPGTEVTQYSLLGDVELADPAALSFGPNAGPGGMVFAIPRPGYVRVVVADPAPPADRDTPVTLAELRVAVESALGRSVELRDPRWLTRFGDAARQAAEYVRGRVVLAGDAAHIHPPAGAVGVNVALDDAVNLGWKLAATVRGTAPVHLLASYHAERHAAGARVLANTQAQVWLAKEPEGPVADLLTRIAGAPHGNRALAETITGLDTRYETRPGGEHPWLGRLARNLALTTAAGATDLATLLTPGRGVLVDLTGGLVAGEAAAWADRVDLVVAETAAPQEFRALLLRPDGHVAWLSTSDGVAGLREALGYWFGSAAG
ncbi:2-polyprenyl-6-methoxyphenol hydroxylase-like FAD-dependent oxidoreductase [Crossiella equi]|uniref:2-polyprenyl-6-methoxyphenol hydroxylase-like FAD-dependent oxidoreductase n=1 Tax=Crossiella equi TaxID=130796 RepID=A0ABS5A3S7_9PSEU|nr:FAD-dependent monooxygenase [Crossiella equi]MBP2471231.1 2-polyprenyl-6-methoxyphenol hydroxylase-like FAD-dependent oxidoreductase [Crossiella equi]